MLLRVVGTPARALSAVLVLAAVGAQVWILVTRGSFNLRRLASDNPRAHVDFDSFHRSAQALLRGADIYDTAAVLPNLNPPLLTVVLAPLGALGAQSAYRVLLLVTVVLVVGSVLVVAREVRLPGADTGVVVAVVLLSGPLLATLGLGQIYALLTVALTASWLAERRGMPVVAGAAMGIAVALKPSLAPLLLLPVLRRSWRTAVAAGLAVVLGTGLGVVAAGPSASVTWVGLVLGNPVQTYVDNASLPATVVRLTSDSGYGQPLVELPGGLVVGFVAGLVVLVATLWLVRGPTEYALWAVAAASLVASPVTWHTYLVVLVPGVVLVLVRSRVLAAPLLALLLIGQEWPGLVLGDDGAGSALPASLYAAGWIGQLAGWIGQLAGWIGKLGGAAGRGVPGGSVTAVSRADLDKNPRDVAAMFDGVARRYDVTNTILTAGQDRRWRRLTREALDLRPGEKVLDLAAGTAVSTVELERSGAWCVAADFSLGMLAAGQDRGVPKAAADALALPFRDAVFDAVTISFGLRNVADTDRALRELARVTRPGGRLVVCEFGRPTWAPFRAAYHLGLEHVLPAIAARVSSNAQAYRYLGESIRDWPPQPELAARIAQAGWSGVGWRDLTFGAVALHRARRALG